jgi:prevent-host-death family protein
MKTVGVRELKANISELLQSVYESGETVEVTRHGQVIARLVPPHHAQHMDRDANGAWTELNELAAEISALWPNGVSAQDAINDVRRDL